MNNVLFVRADWDADARVWVATSDDVPGLATEAATVEELTAKLQVLIPELFEANGEPFVDVPVELMTRRFETMGRRAARWAAISRRS